MYEYYPREKLIKMYPILETEADILVNFVSCDGVMAYKLSSVIGDLNPDVKYKFQNACAEGKVDRGKIIIVKKVNKFTDHFPSLVHIPIKPDFKSPAIYEYVREGFEKLAFAYSSGKVAISKIAIQRGSIPDEMLEKALSGLELPEVLLYEEIDYYGELESIKNKREEKEREEALRLKEEALRLKEEDKQRKALEKQKAKEDKAKK